MKPYCYYYFNLFYNLFSTLW